MIVSKSRLLYYFPIKCAQFIAIYFTYTTAVCYKYIYIYIVATKRDRKLYINNSDLYFLTLIVILPLCFCFLQTGCKKAECGALLQSSIAVLVMFIGSLQRWSVSVEHTQQLIASPVCT